MKNDAALDIPLKMLTPVKIGSQSEASGFLWPMRNHLTPTILFQWDDTPHAIYLGDNEAMRFFPIEQATSLHGLLVADVEFVVDVTSRYDSLRKSDPLGALVLQDSMAHLVGIRRGNQFADPAPVPLWAVNDTDGSDEATGFYRWKLIVRDGDRNIELWKHEGAAPE